MAKLFAHRGFVSESAPQNSIKSLDATKDHNFAGIEFDVHFIDEKLVVTHDHPLLEKIESLPQLKDYFKYKNDLKYWMDFKNVDEENVSQLLSALKEEIKRADIDINNIYFVLGALEVPDYNKAAILFKEIAKTLGTQAKLAAFCRHDSNVEELKSLIKNDNNIKYLSIFHEMITPELINELSDIKIMAWSVNEVAKIMKLKKLGINYVATDKIIPKLLDSVDTI